MKEKLYGLNDSINTATLLYFVVAAFILSLNRYGHNGKAALVAPVGADLREMKDRSVAEAGPGHIRAESKACGLPRLESYLRFIGGP